MVSKASVQSAVRVLILVLGLTSYAHGRPGIFNYAETAASGSADAFGIMSMASEGASGFASGALDTFRVIGEGVSDIATDVWDQSAQTFQRIPLAVQDTARGAVDGFSDAYGATKTYFADNVRSGGRLASGALQTGFGVTKDAVGAAGDFANDVRSSVRNGFGDAADAVDDFAGDFVDSSVGFLGAATGVVENVALRGIENFAHVLVPSRF